MKTTLKEPMYEHNVQCPHCKSRMIMRVQLSLDEMDKLQSGIICPFCSTHFILDKKTLNL